MSSLPIEEPRTRLHGLRNFVALIVSDIEAGHPEEARLRAIDLWNDLHEGGPYDAAVSEKSSAPRRRRARGRRRKIGG